MGANINLNADDARLQQKYRNGFNRLYIKTLCTSKLTMGNIEGHKKRQPALSRVGVFSA